MEPLNNKQKSIAKSIAQWIVTLTSPIWIVPVVVVGLVICVFMETHDKLCGDKPKGGGGSGAV